MGIYQPACTSDELYHYGVLGMKWGVRRARRSEKMALKRAKNAIGVKRTEEAIKKYNERKAKADKLEKEYRDAKKARKSEKAASNVDKKVTKEKAAKYAAKGAKIAGKLATASLIDDVFYGGAGKKIAKETVKQTGRAVVTAYTMARGGYDIHWYDK